MTRVLLGLLIGIALLTAGVLLWQERASEVTASGPRGPAAARPVPVQTAAVETRDLVQRLYLSGSLEASSRTEVVARVAGRVAAIPVDIGDAVPPGSLLLQLESEEFEQERLRAEAERAVARAQLAETRESLNAARRERDRVRELRDQGIASAAELEAAETQVALQQTRIDLGQAQLRQREAALRSAQIRADYARVEADWAGHGLRHVTERLTDPGAIVQANTPVLTLVALDPLRAVVFVAETDYARLAVGQSVRLRGAANAQQAFTGTVARIAPEFRQASRQARVEIAVPNPEARLRPGMFMEIAIDLQRRDQVQAVPRDALLQRAAGFVAFTIDAAADPPVARLHRVTPGIRDGEWVEILEPELTGTVVTLGQHLLTDGNPVRLAIPESPESHTDEAPSNADTAQDGAQGEDRTGRGSAP